MKIKTLYQTLEKRGNPTEILTKGPFSCKWENAWLGKGYYFWDTFIENAHWWGKVRYGDNYIITNMICDFDTEKCFDLVGDTEHLSEFSACLSIMEEEELVDPSTTVARVIDFFRSKIGFDFEAIRVYGIKSISEHKKENHEYRNRLTFEIDKPQYLDLTPAIQLCIFNKTGLNLRNIKIEYPDGFNENYVI